MAEFSAVKAGLYAFRRREHRFVLTGATFGYLLGVCLIGTVFAVAAWPALSDLFSWYASVFRAAQEGGTPPEPAPAIIFAVAPWYGGYILTTLLWMSVYEAACLRWMVRGETGGVLSLSLNGDAARVFVTYLLWLMLFIVFCVVVGSFYGALIAINHATPNLRVLMMVLGALAPLGLLSLLLWVATRLSPAAAMSVAQKKFAFFAAWGVTRGRFWDLLGAFFLILAIYLAVGFVLQALMRIPLTQAMYPLMQEGMHDGDFSTLMTRVRDVFATPLIAGVLIAYVVVSFILSCVVRLAWFGVNAYAVAAASGPDDPMPAAVASAPQGQPSPAPSPPPHETRPSAGASGAPVMQSEGEPSAEAGAADTGDAEKAQDQQASPSEDLPPETSDSPRPT